MEDIVVLVIFGLIILFNFIIKKMAGASQERAEAGDSTQSSEGGKGYSVPQEEIREFLHEIKKQSGGGQTGEERRTASAGSAGRVRQTQGSATRSAGGGGRSQPSRKKRKPKGQKGRKEKTRASSGEKTLSEKKERLARSGKMTKRSKAYRVPSKGQSGNISLEELVGMDRSQLQKAVVMSEVLGKPVSLREK